MSSRAAPRRIIGARRSLEQSPVVVARDSSERQTLLIVDDDPDVSRALAFMTAARGFGVQRCGSAGEAISLAASGRRFAGLIIDQKLPDLQGIELLARLRGLGVEAPAVMITTGPSPTLKRQAAAAGAPIVEKPLLDEDLFTQLRRLIGPA